VTFKAARRHKTEIKAAVQLMFKVDVKAIAVVNTKGKQRFGKSMGRRDNIRKGLCDAATRSRAEHRRESA
jgi:large subunit ribosomal protein L23